MGRVIGFLFLIVIGILGCRDSEKAISKLEIAEKYYDALKTSDEALMRSLLMDSLLTKETEYDYEYTFSHEGYIEWLKWDALFNPEYKILDMTEEDDLVKARISKVDERITFLHEAPIVTEHLIRFDKDKISAVETTKYVVFDDSLFVSNRGKLLSWIDKFHPELDGFIFDQTEAGGRKYLKALELYKNANEN